MTLAQLSEVARRVHNRRCEDDATWGTNTAGGYYSLWEWCQLQLEGKPAGDLNWLARRHIQSIVDLVPLDDELTASPTALWRACPAPDGEHWLPWELYRHTPLWNCYTGSDARRWRRVAHRWAKEDRRKWPCHLIAVRALPAGPPLPLASMADHYDLPPYAD